MFDINDMIADAFMIPLQKAIKEGYITISGNEGKRKITYVASENFRRSRRKSACGVLCRIDL